jgi:hypothetical protein
MEWKEFKGAETKGLPKTYRCVLVQASGTATIAPSVSVGYLKYAAGDKGSPYFLTGGVIRTEDIKITHWCDCLGDEFYAPLWPGLRNSKKQCRK